MMFVKSKDKAFLESIAKVMGEGAKLDEEQRQKAAEYLERNAYAGMRLEESSEQLDEVSKSTLKSYMKKASADIQSTAKNVGPKQSDYWNARARIERRQEGIKQAQRMLPVAKEEVEFELNDLLEYMLTADFEQLDEVSKNTLKSYMHKAGISFINAHDPQKYGKAGEGVSAQSDTKTISKRTKGISRALAKLTKEEFEQLDEISKGTLGSYIKKATSAGDERSISNLSSRAADKLNNPEGDDTGEKDDKKSFIRSKGIARAVNRLTKEETEIEESIEDRLEAAREKAAAKGKIKDKEEKAQSPVRKVAGKAYGGSKQKEDKVEESAEIEEGILDQVRNKMGSTATGQRPADRSPNFDGKTGKALHATSNLAGMRSKMLKKEEVELDEVSQQALSNVFHGRLQQAQKAERGSPEHTKAVSSMKKVSSTMTKRTQQQLKNMSPAEYSKSFAASADQDRKEHPRWTHEEVELDEVVKTTVKAAGKYLSVPTKEIDRYGKVATANAMVGKGGKTEKTGVHSPVKFEEVELGEAAVHPMGVHVIRHPGGKMQVHAVGSKVQGIEVGEHLHDNDLDDLADMGHKIKEVKPKAVKESRSLSSIISKMVATQQVEEGFEVRFDDGTDEFIEAGIYEAVKAAVQALDEEASQQVTEYAFGSLTNFMNIHKMVS